MGEPAVPGIDNPDSDLGAQLAAAYRAKGSDYSPRTHHLNEDGSAKFTNRLILETSPYLLQHAHNPVNWHAWGSEAFDKARALGRPVFLSIGYSTCHWCHVMERESFEDEEIAEFMNRNFIAIKVDREERPDLDDIYMRAVQALTGRGGWPMTVVLTPDQKPFFGGTYFPPRTGARGAREGILEILQRLAIRYAESPDEVVAEAEQLTRRVIAGGRGRPPGDMPDASAITRSAQSLAQRFDPRFAGFGRAPKFPQPSRLMLLARYARRTGDAGAKRMIRETLQKMADGGMYDQVGGGFHRYSVDARWLVPHFEKMLYDNAQLTLAYLEGAQLLGEPHFNHIARETLDYVAREMTAQSGGFYSATDADSPVPGRPNHFEEGLFHTWTPAELEEALSDETDRRLVTTHYSVSDRGNFEGRNILSVVRPLANVAQQLGITESEAKTKLARIKAHLRTVRARRLPPLRDDKIIAAWNGLMISAFSKGAIALGENRYAEIASRAADFILESMRTEGRLSRTHHEGRAKHAGTLDDYAFVIAGLIDVYEATGTVRYLREAIALQGVLDQRFADTRGGYFFVADDHENLLSRDKPGYDGALPAGNSVTAHNLLRLAEITTEHSYVEKADKLFAAFSTSMTRGAAPRMLAALDWRLDTARSVVIVGEPGRDALLNQLRQSFAPNIFLTTLPESGPEAQHSVIPLLEGKVAMNGRATAYVCEEGRCELPTSDPRTFARQLAKVVPLSEPAPPALQVSGSN